MASSLIRGKYVISKVLSRTQAQVIEDGAVFQRDGKIVEVGSYRDLAAKHQPDEVIGSSEHVVVPGFVNGHHHVGLTPLQLGSLDDSGELRRASRLAARDVDPYLDTLYSAFELVGSGVTTVQHLHYSARGGLERVYEAAEKVLKAYQDIGMRVSYSFALRDQNHLAYETDEDFIKRLPPHLASWVAEHVGGRAMPLEDHLSLFERLWERYRSQERVRIQLGPTNLHWCSDRALRIVKEYADKYDACMHMHLLETAYQKEYARRRTGGTTAVGYIHKFGLLGPRMTLGHAIWVTAEEIDLIAQTQTRVCTNASSNLRVRGGIAPLNAWEARGVRVGIGIDEAGLNDDRDMLQEMRLVFNLHRVPGMDDAVPTAAQVLRMATEDGALTTPFGGEIGTLEPGKAADLVVIDWSGIAYPYLDADVPPLDALLQRAKASQVRTVLVAGEPILRDGRFTRVDREQALEELAASLRVPGRPDEERRRQVAREVYPYFKRSYEGYLEGQVRQPFYEMNSKT